MRQFHVRRGEIPVIPDDTYQGLGRRLELALLVLDAAFQQLNVRVRPTLRIYFAECGLGVFVATNLQQVRRIGHP